MGDLTRRAFLRGTILTGATIAAGGLSTTSTTPVKVLPAAKSVIKFKNLNVLSPKAKAYRTFLRGINVRLFQQSSKGVVTKTPLTNVITREPIHGEEKKLLGKQKSPAREVFEVATRKQRVVRYRGERVSAKELRSGTSGAWNVAKQISPDPKSKAPPSKRTKAIWARHTDTIAKNLTISARKELARELRVQKKANPDRMFKKMSARKHSENMKNKSKGARVGGGGKQALPGLESARNPTGMSLITQRYTL